MALFIYFVINVNNFCSFEDEEGFEEDDTQTKCSLMLDQSAVIIVYDLYRYSAIKQIHLNLIPSVLFTSYRGAMSGFRC